MAKKAVFVMKDDRIDYTTVDAVGVGDIVIIGPLVGVALTDIAAAKSGTVLVEGCFTVVSKTGESFAVGDVLYWDATAKALTKTATDNTRAGIALSVKETAGTEVLIRLNY